MRLLDESNAGWSCGENKRALVLREQLNGSPLRTQGTYVVVNAELAALLPPLRVFFAGQEVLLHRKTRLGTRQLSRGKSTLYGQPPQLYRKQTLK